MENKYSSADTSFVESYVNSHLYVSSPPAPKSLRRGRRQKIATFSEVQNRTKAVKFVLLVGPPIKVT